MTWAADPDAGTAADPSALARLRARPWLRDAAAARLFAALAPAALRFVGGCVRDGLLGRTGADIDLATDLEPAQTLAALRAAGIKVVPTGIEHGTVTAVIDGQPFEITTLRRDVTTDGRRATVAFTRDWREDAARRDFTINAMSCDRAGRLYDYFGGLGDLAAGRVRFVGDAERRIREDVLRLLRFFRFHAHYGQGRPDADGLRAATALAPLLPGLSGERVRSEILKLLAAADPVPVWQVMIDHGIIAPLLPEAGAVAALDRLVRLGGTDPLLRLSVLLPPEDSVVDGIADRLRLSNVQRERLGRLTGRLDLNGPFTAPLYDLGPATVADLALVTAARDGGDPTPALAAALAWQPRRFPLAGRDLVAQGVPPGPEIGHWLAELEAWWRADGYGADHAACIAELRRRLGR